MPPAKVGTFPATVNWNKLFLQSSMFLGVEHGFRWATEPGTRDMKGPFFQGYANSLRNLHGWDDGDPFYVNYLGHPMQGAIAGLIWAQNDNRYRDVEFGANRRYWTSRARAAAWSFAYSTQFEIGPMSEATIGYIQSSYPQQGFVDWVVTPTIGMGWMIAEDALDRYVIGAFENKVSNRYARILVRSWLNPSRSFSNALAFKAPWHRDTRAGVVRYSPATHRKSKPLPSIEREALPGPAPFEFAVTGSVISFPGSGQACAGGGADGSFRLASQWQLATRMDGCKMAGLPKAPQPFRFSGDYLAYQIGPRWVPAASSRWSPYAEVLVGGNRMTQEYMNVEKQTAYEANPDNIQGRRPPTAEFADFKETNRFMISAGTGLDLKLGQSIALRVASLGYRHSWTNALNGYDYNSGLMFSTGIVIRVGAW